MGRKGIGKLAIFGAARTVTVETVKKHVMNVFSMNVDEMRKQARETGCYQPKVIEYCKNVKKEQGTKVIMSELKRSTPVNEEVVKRGIARSFSVIDGKEFTVTVNRTPISPADKFDKDNLKYYWELPEEAIDKAHPDWTASGWVGATELPVEEDERGVIVFARGKLLQKPTLFDIKAGEKFTYSYLVGELHAEFLDKNEDLISTDRQSVVWESPEGVALRKWASDKLRGIAEKYADSEWKNRSSEVTADPAISECLKKLSEPEKNVATKVILTVVKSEKLDQERRVELVKYMMQTFEYGVFQQIISDNSYKRR